MSEETSGSAFTFSLSLQGSNFSSTKLSKKCIHADDVFVFVCVAFKNFVYRVYHSKQQEEEVDKLSIYMEIRCMSTEM